MAPEALGFTLKMILFIFANSLAVGIILAFITYFSTALNIEKGSNAGLLRQKLILGSANILFLCTGLTGLIILVNNNLARAFAIGAAMALVRFRSKLSQKSLGANFLFGIIAGIACGLNELTVAWVVTGMYFILQLFLLLIVWINRKLSGGKIPPMPLKEDDLSEDDD